MVKNLSCVSYGSLKRFPHTFTTEGEGGGAPQKEMKGAMGRDPVVSRGDVIFEGPKAIKDDKIMSLFHQSATLFGCPQKT